MEKIWVHGTKKYNIGIEIFLIACVIIAVALLPLMLITKLIVFYVLALLFLMLSLSLIVLVVTDPCYIEATEQFAVAKNIFGITIKKCCWNDISAMQFQLLNIGLGDLTPQKYLIIYFNTSPFTPVNFFSFRLNKHLISVLPTADNMKRLKYYMRNSVVANDKIWEAWTHEKEDENPFD